MAFIPGIDVSRWQTDVDWKAVRKAGIRYAFIKATEGINVVDPKFSFNWQAAKEAGVVRGAYHFFRPLLDPRQQAQLFLKTVTHEPGDLPPVLDLEIHDNLKNDKLIRNAQIWVDAVCDATGMKPILYSGVSFSNDHFSVPAGGPPDWTAAHLFWIANYLGEEAAQPFLPRGWKKWHFWQYTSTGRVAGIKGNVDRNWFNGTLEELGKLCGTTLEEDVSGETGEEEGSQEPGAGGGAVFTPAQPASQVTGTTYVVKAGDSLKEISAQFNLLLKDLIKANPQLIQPGMKLNIPTAEGGDETPPPQADQFYTVKAGDTLSAIAKRFNTTVEALVQANLIPDPDQIEIGQRLKIA